VDRSKYYRQDGYQQGFMDAKRTGGKIKQENIDKYLNTETKNLSTTHSRDFIKGWYEGFSEGVEKTICSLAQNDTFGENHIYQEYSIFKSC
jgi:hypothetical protein